MTPTILAFGVLSVALSGAGAFLAIHSPRRSPGPVVPALIATLVSATLLSVTESSRATDQPRYVRRIERISAEGIAALRDASNEPVVGLYMYASTKLPASDVAFFALISLSVLFLIYRAVTIFAPAIQATLILVSFILTGFFTAYTSNTVRQGLAVAFIYLAMAITAREGFRGKATLLLMVAALTHYASIATVLVSALVLRLNPRISTLIRAWLLSAALFFAGFGFQIGVLLSSMSPTVSAYTLERPQSRLDFVIAHTTVLLAAALFRHLGVSTGDDPLYRRSLQMLMAHSALFLAFGFIAYSDRLASVVVVFAVTVIWLPLFRLRRAEGGIIRLGVLLAFVLFAISPLGVAEFFR